MVVTVRWREWLLGLLHRFGLNFSNAGAKIAPMDSRARAIVLVVPCLFLVARSGFAWGAQGHRVVARIAAKNLSQVARTKLAAILGTNDAGLDAAMAQAATWPDDIDKTKTGSRNWHFIDVPVSKPFSTAGLCALHDCVIDQIANMRNRLAANLKGFTLKAPPNPPRPMTSQEVAFLVHFVGDLHQPLHASTNGDRGGNCVGLTNPIAHANGDQATTELHAAWDVDEVLAVFKKHGDSEDQTAATLFERFKSGAPVAQSTVTGWARESNAMARKDIYQKLHLPNRTAPAGQCAPGIAPVSIDQAYLDGNIADVEQRLLQAGIRLSNVLNQICAGVGCKANP